MCPARLLISPHCQYFIKRGFQLQAELMVDFFFNGRAEPKIMSYDSIHSPDCLAVTTAGIAVALSEVPNAKIIAGVRIGLIGNKFVVNPTTKEMESSELDPMLAGTDSAILMIEVAVREICRELESLVKKCGKPKVVNAIKLPPDELYRYVEDISGHELMNALQIRSKIPRRKALSVMEEKVISILTEDGYVAKDQVPVEVVTDNCDDEDEDEEVVSDGEVDEGDVHIKLLSRKPIPLLFSEVDVKLVFKEVTSKFLRKRIVEVSPPPVPATDATGDPPPP